MALRIQFKFHQYLLRANLMLAKLYLMWLVEHFLLDWGFWCMYRKAPFLLQYMWTTYMYIYIHV